VRTRTFAEICARQGQLDEAIAIYRELIVKKPDDSTLAARVRELELEREGLAAAGLLPAPPAPEPEAPPSRPPQALASAPPRPLPTDLPPRGARGKKKAAAQAPPQAATTKPAGALEPDALARLRLLDRLEKILHRIQNRRRRTHA